MGVVETGELWVTETAVIMYNKIVLLYTWMSQILKLSNYYSTVS